MGLSLNEESELSEEEQNVLSKFREEKLDSNLMNGNLKLKQKKIQKPGNIDQHVFILS